MKRMGTTADASSVAPRAHSGQRSETSPGALARTLARKPFTASAWRDLLFCGASSLLGLSILAILAALAALPLLARMVLQGSPAAGGQAHHAGAPAFLAPVLIALLVALAALLVLVPRIARALGMAHRLLAERVLDQHVAAPPPARRAGSPASWLRASLADGPGWRAVGYLAVKLPVALLGFYAVVVWWGAGLANMTYPLWWPWTRNHPPTVRLSPVPALTPFGVLHIGTFPGTFAAFAAGAAMVATAPWVTQAVVAADLWLMRGLLGSGRLAQRVADLERSRALAVDDAAALLRRLERDLHDGAQIRLTTLAMNLGMAMAKLGDEEQPDLAAVRQLVGAAHRGAKDALVELRVLARGIHPPVLDNGLSDALASLAASSPVPTELDATIPHRPSPAIETIAYFCAAELLTNAVKHGNAAKITITVSETGQLLVLRVTDDGKGGADPASGSGLAGLAHRVGTVDGRLDVVSPAGGPTAVTVQLPLHA
jgi:signal transduction histidine kinase